MALDPVVLRKVVNALERAFVDYDDLDELVAFTLPERIGNLANKYGRHNNVVLQLVTKVDAHGWTARLLAGARALRVDNREIFEAAQALGMSAAADSLDTLQRLITPKMPDFDPQLLVKHITELEGRVCRVETPGNLGTGFLIGPDRVLTCKHVVGSVPASGITLRFDYYVTTDGKTTPGVEVNLAPGGILAESPPTTKEEETGGSSDDPRPADCLDFALLRLASSVGEAPRFGAVGPGAARGWIPVPTAAPTLAQGDLVFVMQHPMGAPMKLSLGVEPTGFRGLNANATRFNHGVNTLGGSSGSPCLDRNWKLVALHHGANSNGTGLAGSNRAIPIQRIREHLRALGQEALLDA